MREGDGTCLNDSTWIIRGIGRNGIVPVYTMTHWLLGTLEDVAQHRLQFTRTNRNLIWIVDLYKNGKSFYHNENVVPTEDHDLLRLEVDTSQWSSIGFRAWLNDAAYNASDTCLFLSLRTPSGHLIDCWHFSKVFPCNYSREVDRWNVIFGFESVEKVKPIFEKPTVHWWNFSYEENSWVGIAKVDIVEVVRECESQSQIQALGEIYQSNYRLVLLDYAKQQLRHPHGFTVLSPHEE